MTGAFLRFCFISGFLIPFFPRSGTLLLLRHIIEYNDTKKGISMKPKLEVCRVSYSYHSLDGETPALSDISFTVHAGEFLAIVGPSGCGKSTLLSLLSGLAEPEEGKVLIDGMPLSQAQDSIGYMLQKDHLFPWRSVLSNVSLGLEIRRRLDQDSRSHLLQMLETYGPNPYPGPKP